MRVHWIHRLSVTAYAQLVKLYPRSFRDAFEADMIDTFRDWIEAPPRSLRRLVTVWWVVASELPRTLVAEHRAARRANLQTPEAVATSGAGQGRGLVDGAIRAVALGIALSLVVWLVLVCRDPNARGIEIWGVVATTAMAVLCGLAGSGTGLAGVWRAMRPPMVLFVMLLGVDLWLRPSAGGLSPGILVFAACAGLVCFALVSAIRLGREGIGAPRQGNPA